MNESTWRRSRWVDAGALNLVFALAFFGTACQRQARVAPPAPDASLVMEEAENAFRGGDYKLAAPLYRDALVEGTGAEREQALIRLALLHALPASGLRDHEQSRMYLAILEEEHPGSLTGEVIWTRRLLSAIEDGEREVLQSTAENERLEAEMAELEREGNALRTTLAVLLPLEAPPADEPAEDAPAAVGAPESDGPASPAEQEDQASDEEIEASYDAEAVAAALERLRAEYPDSEIVRRLETIPALYSRLEALEASRNAQADEIGQLTARLAALNAELERLKEIDLRRRPQN